MGSSLHCCKHDSPRLIVFVKLIIGLMFGYTCFLMIATAVNVLSTKIIGQTIPDQSGTMNMDVGGVEWSVTNTVIGQFTMPQSHVSVHTTAGHINWLIENAGLQLEGNWRYAYRWRFVKIRDNGRFEMTVTGAAASVSLALGADQHGQPTVSVQGCSCSIDTLRVRFHGGASWLYNLFSRAIAGPIRREISSAVCQAATSTINKSGMEELSTLNLKIRLSDNSPLIADFRLRSPPNLIGPIGSVGESYVETSHHVHIYYENSGELGDLREAGEESSVINTSSDFSRLPNRMMTAFIPQDAANRLGYVLHTHGVLSHVVTKDNTPPVMQKFFSTRCTLLNGPCFGSFFPTAASLNPANTAHYIQLNMSTTEPPTLHINEATQSMQGLFTGVLNVVLPTNNNNNHNSNSSSSSESSDRRSGDGVVVLSMSVSATVDVSVSMEGHQVRARVSRLIPTVNVTHSLLGPVSTAPLTRLIGYIADSFIIPSLNEVGERGVDLPTMEGVRFIRPTIILVNRALLVSTDLQYTP